MIKVAIIGYVIMLAFSYSCQSCMEDSAYWMPYWIWDQLFGGGVVLWGVAWRYSKKYKVPCLAVFIFSIIRCLWNVCCYLFGINASNTHWTIVLFFCLLPIIFYTLFTPDGRVTKFLEKYSP